MKLEDQYKKAQSMFEKQQGHSNLVTEPKQDLQDKLENCSPSTSSNENKASESEKICNSLPSKLQAGIFRGIVSASGSKFEWEIPLRAPAFFLNMGKVR